MGMGTAVMVQIQHVRELTSREGVAAHMAKFDDDATVRNNVRLYGDDRERALGERAGTGQPGAEREEKKTPPGGTSAHRDRKQELGSLTATARTGLQE